MSIISRLFKNFKFERPDWENLPMILISILAIIGITIFYNVTHPTEEGEPLPEVKAYPIQVEAQEESEEEIIASPEGKNENAPLSDDEMLAMVAMSEAGNQSLLGKCAVVATILNRCDKWGMSVEEVVSSPHQYSFPYYGTISEECYLAIEIVRNYRELFPENLYYFRNTKYHDFGEPYMQIEDHYFSIGKENET